MCFVKTTQKNIKNIRLKINGTTIKQRNIRTVKYSNIRDSEYTISWKYND